MKRGHGLPSFEENISWDSEAILRAQRHESEMQKQEETARKRVVTLDECASRCAPPFPAVLPPSGVRHPWTSQVHPPHRPPLLSAPLPRESD